MRVLLDEQLPRHLARDLTGHQVRTVQQERWTGLKNGELLQRAAEGGFEVFVTADQNLEYQQNLTHARLGVVVLAARKSRSRRSPPAGAGHTGRYRQRSTRRGGACRCLTSAWSGPA